MSLADSRARVSYGSLPMHDPCRPNRCLKNTFAGERRRSALAAAGGLALSAGLLLVLVVARSPGTPPLDDGSVSRPPRHVDDHLSMLQLGENTGVIPSKEKKKSPYLFGGKGGSPATYEAMLNDGRPMTAKSCLEEFTDEFRENCLALFKPKKRSELEAVTSSCKWKSEPWKPKLYSPYRAAFSGLQDNVAPVAHQGPGSIPDQESLVDDSTWQFERCFAGSRDVVPGKTSARGAWEMVRVGPFTTFGGKDWTSLLFTDLDFGRDWHWKNKAGEPRVFAVRDYVLGAINPRGELLSYPPLHMHHYHIEDTHNPRDKDHPGQIGFNGRMITHGDDYCTHSSGGADCTIRRMNDGYATMMQLPLLLTADVNDVRAANSSGMSWYLLAAIRGMPDDGTFKPFTQTRMVFNPYDDLGPLSLPDQQFGLPGYDQKGLGYFGTYLVPADIRTAYWQEGHFLKTAPVLWAYLHTHANWMEEYMLYVGASAAELDMRSLPFSNITANRQAQRMPEVSYNDIQRAKVQLAARAQEAGAALACRYKRSNQLREIIPGTSELDNSFYRAATPCVPFQIARGMSYVGVFIHSPSSDAARNVFTEPVSRSHGNQPLVGQHAFIRLFTSIADQGEKGASCSLGCGYQHSLAPNATK